MIIARKLDELITARRKLPGTVGLVPTMGFLHEGHLSLVRRAGQECTSVIVTIFVNPTQFGKNEDLDQYPRDIDHDLQLLEQAKVDIVWIPPATEMYPAGFQTWVEVTELTKPLEGEIRPGHFRGVTTIVAKLFNAVRPDTAYFGQKDAQQCAVIRQMTRDLSYPIQINICPTLREPDGLAKSSRNSYLDPKQRKAAVILFQALSKAKDAFDNGERKAETIRKLAADVINSEPNAVLQYVSCADFETLSEINNIDQKAILSLAVFIGKTRLIDNFILG